MRKNLIIGFVFLIVLVSSVVFLFYQSSGNTLLTINDKNTNLSSNSEAKENKNQDMNLSGGKANNNTSNQNINSNKKVYKGKTYKIFTELNATGPYEVVCPYCGGIASQIGDAEEVGHYWFYYYQCSSCGANIAEKGLNY